MTIFRAWPAKKPASFLLTSGQVANKNIPRPEYSQPELYREPWLYLNRYWKFAFDFSDSGEKADKLQEKGFDQIILVPFAPEREISGIGFLDLMPAIEYKRTYSLFPAQNLGQKENSPSF